jgi:hypothetical protein
MASGITNWKRPWTDEDTRDPITPSEPKTQAPVGERYGAEALGYKPGISREELEQVKAELIGKGEGKPKESRQIFAGPNPTGDAYQRYLNAQGSPTMSKRIRTDSPWSEAKGRPGDRPWADMQATSFGETKKQHIAALQQKYGLDENNNPKPGFEPLPNNARPTYDHREPNRSTPYESLPPISRNRDIPSPYSSRYTSCDDCEKAAAVANKLASGLSRLHDQLRTVLNKGRIISGEVS